MQATSDPSHSFNPSLTSGALLAGRYRLVEIIGRGGMATVWRAHDERLGRDVAVKICRPSPFQPQPPLAEQRFSRALLHPNIVSIFDAGEIPPPGPSGTFVVMEYVNGTTALQIAPIAWRLAVDVVRQAADGLATLHERGIVHCDVKPGNLLIDRGGRVLVADLGIATAVDGEMGDYVHGSPSYIAPERLTGECASPRIDVYGLGGVLAFLITGQRPPDGPVALPLGCPLPIAEVIGRARANDPDERYPDARVFRNELVEAAGRAERGDDRVIHEETAPHTGHRQQPGSSRQVIGHPTRVRQPARRPSAQETAALTASPVIVAARATTGRQHGSVRRHVATVFAATVIVLLLILVVGMIVRQVVSVDSALAGPPVTHITLLVEPR